MKKNITKMVALMLGSAMLISYSGCSGMSEQVPELIEPAAQSELFRAVALRQVGSMYVVEGDIVPEEYCHCFKRSVNIENISCEVGQYVEKGQVIATADLKTVSSELADKKAYLEYVKSEHALTLEMNKYELASLQCAQSAAEAAGSAEAGDAKKAVEEYVDKTNLDEELYKFLVEDIEHDIAELGETMSDGTLKAKVSGYVTYVKNTDSGNFVTPDENVVIVADMDNTYIETPSVNTLSYRSGYYDLSKFETKYAMYDGKRTEITERSYTDKESALMNSRKTYASTRFDMEDGIKGEVGEKVLLYFYKNSRNEVLSIGVDSENKDDAGSFVYVKKDKDNLEKRYVELGERDDSYIEVISGLEEGEMVLCSQDSMPPAEYEEVEVNKTDYTVTQSARTYKPAHLSGDSYFAEKLGKVEEIVLREDDTFKAGDTLMIIDTGAGNSEIVSIQNEITSLALDHTKTCQSINDSIGEMQANIQKNNQTVDNCKSRIKNLQNSGGSDAEIASLRKTVELTEKQNNVLINSKACLEKQREIEELSYNYNMDSLNKRLNNAKKLNVGGGKYYVKAKSDGVVAKVHVTKGEVLKSDKGMPLLVSTYQTSENKYTLVMSAETENIHLNDVIEFKVKDSDEKYYCKSITRAYGNKYFAYTEDDKAYCTSFPKEKKINTEFVIETESSDFKSENGYRDFDEIIVKSTYKDVCVIPNTLVSTETSKDQKTTYYYVWKITENGLEKQFIARGNEYGIGDGDVTVVVAGLSAGDKIAKKK